MVLLQVLMMPTLVLSARICPQGLEATLYACLMSLLNAGSATSDALGGLLTHLLGVTSSDFNHLFGLVLLCSCLSGIPLVLLGWIPAAVDTDSDKVSASEEGDEEDASLDDDDVTAAELVPLQAEMVKLR